MGEASGPLRTGREGVAPINEESREKLRAGNYLVATWDAMTDGHQYDGVISQVVNGRFIVMTRVMTRVGEIERPESF